MRKGNNGGHFRSRVYFIKEFNHEPHAFLIPVSTISNNGLSDISESKENYVFAPARISIFREENFYKNKFSICKREVAAMAKPSLLMAKICLEDHIRYYQAFILTNIKSIFEIEDNNFI